MRDNNRNTGISAQQVSARLKQYRANGGTFAKIEAETEVSRTAISQLANHGTPMHQLKLEKIHAWLEVNAPELTQEATQSAEAEPSFVSMDGPKQVESMPETPYKTSIEIYPTQDYKDLIGWCNKVFLKRQVGAIIGNPRTGKTTALRAYCTLNPSAHYVECWSSMRVGDMLDIMGAAAEQKLMGSVYKKQQQLLDALRGRSDIMFLFDEAEYLEKWNIEKFEILRKVWDNTGTPIVLCGTQELRRVLTHGSGSANRAQLYGRMWCAETNGMLEREALAMLSAYNITPDAAQMLARIAVDKKYGGMGNFTELLSISLDAAEGEQIDAQMVRDAKKYKLFL